MPTYVYEVIQNGEPTGERFEVVQPISEDPLTEHPETGEPVRRVITAVNIGGRWSDDSMSRRMADDDKLGRLGFTKYVKKGDGYYEKTTGKGPNVIHRDKPLKPEDI
ncbi:MAG TPA: FmdB family transcriptional regulator [Planctomycetaceae bacterium]|jgi:hypothetical protein|nr:FmdB family transcriptional regulator [Rhodopirellula sp.]MCH2361273.1 FmdB family transcriptional regulator [Pirellulales bacterium]HAL14128.1 FmdB family transcriptional regulator [Planctomycetaceae bacterium]MCH2611349.1 FmdB family transcriptional regulator [Pirellulales bacterium]HCK71386.1 FmdB family transcriptional regulator [Planctomycetaceae bacterium]|tara:strand:+ start:684 stop:1004 length:321 start_codon:yes stop_codon:yes gene_type:complete